MKWFPQRRVSKTAEIFNITGKITLITMEIDLHELDIFQLDWDDSICDDFCPIWYSHLMGEINNLKF